MANVIWNPGISASNPTVEMIVNEQSATTESIVGNYSDLTWSLVLHRPSSITSSALKNYNAKINNVTVASGSTTIGGVGDKLIASGTHRVYHDPDGTKVDVPFSFYMDIGINWSNVPTGNASGSGEIDLIPIPRATTPILDYSVREMGQLIRITTNPAVAGYSHKIFYSFTGIAKTLIAEKPAGNQYHDWTIPLATLAPKIPNSLSGAVTIEVETYSGATLIGTKTVVFTATVPDYQPSAILALTPVDQYSGKYVQGKSKVSVAITADGLYGSTIATYRTVVNGSIYNTANLTTEVLASSGVNVIETTVTDSRGKIRVITQNITVETYQSPQAISLSVARCLANGTLDEEGAFVKATIQAAISSILNTNTKQTLIKYKLKASGTWTIALNNTTDYSVNTSVVFPADTNSQFDVLLEVNDYFNNGVVTRSADVAVAFTLIDFNSDGKGMAIGKVAEGNGVLDVRGDSYFDGDMLFKNTAGLFKSLVDLFYDVGDVKITMTNVNPSTRYPGTTWIYWGEGQFPVAVDPNQTEFNTVGKTGGVKAHQLSLAEMPAHGHNNTAIIAYSGNAPALSGGSTHWTIAGRKDGGIGDFAAASAGGGQPHNNLPPFKTCYIWQRTA